MASPSPDTPIASTAWLLKGITQSLPGQLRLERGMLSFVHDDGTRRFRVPLEEVRAIVFPWYYFGGGCKLTVDGTRHRFSFVRPNNAGDAIDRMAARVGDVGAVHAQVAGKFQDIGSGRAAGRVWREALRRGT
jgi:hypothetical protein